MRRSNKHPSRAPTSQGSSLAMSNLHLFHQIMEQGTLQRVDRNRGWGTAITSAQLLPDYVLVIALRSSSLYHFLLPTISSFNLQTTLGSSGKYTIGVRLAPHMEAVERRKAGSPVEAAEVAFSETTKLAGKTLESFTHLVSTGDMQGV